MKYLLVFTLINFHSSKQFDGQFQIFHRVIMPLEALFVAFSKLFLIPNFHWNKIPRQINNKRFFTKTIITQRKFRRSKNAIINQRRALDFWTLGCLWPCLYWCEIACRCHQVCELIVNSPSYTATISAQSIRPNGMDKTDRELEQFSC